MNFYENVGEFHRKFDIPAFDPRKPVAFPSKEIMEYRVKFLEEEIIELKKAIAEEFSFGVLSFAQEVEDLLLARLFEGQARGQAAVDKAILHDSIEFAVDDVHAVKRMG